MRLISISILLVALTVGVTGCQSYKAAPAKISANFFDMGHRVDISPHQVRQEKPKRPRLSIGAEWHETSPEEVVLKVLLSGKRFTNLMHVSLNVTNAIDANTQDSALGLETDDTLPTENEETEIVSDLDSSMAHNETDRQVEDAMSDEEWEEEIATEWDEVSGAEVNNDDQTNAEDVAVEEDVAMEGDVAMEENIAMEEDNDNMVDHIMSSQEVEMVAENTDDVIVAGTVESEDNVNDASQGVQVALNGDTNGQGIEKTLNLQAKGHTRYSSFGKAGTKLHSRRDFVVPLNELENIVTAVWASVSVQTPNGDVKGYIVSPDGDKNAAHGAFRRFLYAIKQVNY